jgi:hypothetical protein
VTAVYEGHGVAPELCPSIARLTSAARSTCAAGSALSPTWEAAEAARAIPTSRAGLAARGLATPASTRRDLSALRRRRREARALHASQPTPAGRDSWRAPPPEAYREQPSWRRRTAFASTRSSRAVSRRCSTCGRRSRPGVPSAAPLGARPPSRLPRLRHRSDQAAWCRRHDESHQLPLAFGRAEVERAGSRAAHPSPSSCGRCIPVPGWRPTTSRPIPRLRLPRRVRSARHDVRSDPRPTERLSRLTASALALTTSGAGSRSCRAGAGTLAPGKPAEPRGPRSRIR